MDVLFKKSELEAERGKKARTARDGLRPRRLRATVRAEITREKIVYTVRARAQNAEYCCSRVDGQQHIGIH